MKNAANTILIPLVASVCLLASASLSAATTKIVQMKNKGNGHFLVFEPAFVQVMPGDTIIFQATDKGHDASSIPTMLPPGATPFVGKTGQDVSVTFKEAGLYGVKCTPHFGMGMVALIKVGKKAPNAEAAVAAVQALPGLAKKNMSELLAEAK